MGHHQARTDLRREFDATDVVAEAALVTVVATSYLLGVSTRRMEKLVATLGIDRLSKSQVSQMATTSTPP
jgi:transposase-like protein